MRELPGGTVTFLFTDIEGSTKLLHELGDEYADTLSEHPAPARARSAALFFSRGGMGDSRGRRDGRNGRRFCYAQGLSPGLGRANS